MSPERTGALYADRVIRTTVHGEPEIGPTLIRWRGGVISEVIPCDRLQARSLEPQVLDLGDKLVSPAWVNAHTHLAMSSLRGVGGDGARRGNVVEDLWFRIESQLTPQDVRAFARMGALECLLCGTGAVFDHYYHASAVAQALLDVGLEGVVAPTLQDLAGPGASAWEEALDTTASLDDDLALRASGVVVAVGPHATDTVSDELWQRAVALAVERNLPVHVHVAQSFEEVERACAAGHESPVARLRAVGQLDKVPRTMLVHGIYTTTSDIDSLDPQRVVHVHCPASQAQFAHPAALARWTRIPIALGTDAGACNDGMNVQRELLLLAHSDAWRTTHNEPLHELLDTHVAEGTSRIAEHRLKVFSERESRARPWSVLRAVGAIPGGVHPRLPVGEIVVGARASLAVWDPQHPALWPARDPLRALAFGDAVSALHSLIIGGRIIGEVGAVRAILAQPEVRAWRQEADQRLAALLDRAD